MNPSGSWVGASGHTYELYKTKLSWADASAFATSIGGYLVKVDTSTENKELFTNVKRLLPSTEWNNTRAPDGGNAAYVWLGASDAATEGAWKWVKDGSPLSTSRSEWGKGNLGSEPDNSYNQDYLALGLENWPKGYATGTGFGNAGQWNDVSVNNALYFVVEKETTPSDTTAPTLSSITPSDNATGVSISANIVMTFNEAVKAGSGNILIKSGTTTIATIAVSDTSQVSFSGSTVTINPTNDLNYSTNYSVSLAAGVITDSAGNSFAGSGSNPYDFTTTSLADTTAPLLSSAAPSDNASGVAIDANIILNFNESIQAGTGNFLIKSGATTVATIAVGDTSQVYISGSTITINPTANLAYGTNYSLTIASGVVKDLAGNNWVGTQSNPIDFTTALSNTTDTVRPTVQSFSPVDGATGVAIDSNIVLTFSEAIEFGTGPILLRKGSLTGAYVDTTSSWSSANPTVITIDPKTNLEANTKYYLVLSAGAVKDAAGNLLAANSTYDFQTFSTVGSSSSDSLEAPDDTQWIMDGLAGNDTLTGKGGNDILTGGAGTDWLRGQGGDDLFIINSAAELTAAETITGGDGADELRFAAKAAGTLVVGASVTVETIAIGTGTAASANTTGTVALNVDASAMGAGVSVIGNAGANKLTGTGFDDSLSGGTGADSLLGNGGSDILIGGLGKDTLTGGAGADRFVFDTGLSAANVDIVQDFNVTDDTLVLENAFFAALTATGTLVSGALKIGKIATESDDRIIYDSTNGNLFYDSDGTGATAAVQFAKLQANLAVTNLDFLVV